MSVDLVAWLVDVLDQVERREHAKRVSTDDYFGKPCPVCRRPVEGYEVECRADPSSRVFPCNDELTPAQMGELLNVRPNPDEVVLADIAAKRQIVELHSGNHECSSWNRFHGEFDRCMWIDDDEYCSTVRLLASAYADRPGYREEWRPVLGVEVEEQ